MKQDERNRQINSLYRYNFHKFLNLDKRQFELLVPRINVNPTKQFNKLLLAIPSNLIDLKNQLKLSKIQLNINLNKIKNTFVESKNPYWIIFQDGSKNRGKSPISCIQHLNRNERGLSVIEGIAMHIQYPNIVKDHSVDLIGSKYGRECILTIYHWKRKVMISAICSDVSDYMCGAATCLK